MSALPKSSPKQRNKSFIPHQYYSEETKSPEPSSDQVSPNGTQKSHFKLKNDRFTKSRGKANLLLLSCAECNEIIDYYQKDGKGRLLRCYLDRFMDLKLKQAFTNSTFRKKTAQDLKCSKCSAILGIPMIYRRENRPAFRLIQNKVIFQGIKV